MTVLHERDWQVRAERGRLFARSWSQGGSLRGGAAPILLFHDSLGCVELWRDFPAKLAAGTRHPVVAYDRLGFGRSDAHPGRPGLDFIAREAACVVPLLRERLGFDRFIACGHSVGGGMAIETAARFPDACLAVVTIGAQAFAEQQTLDAIRHAKTELADAEKLAKLEKYHDEKARWVVDAWTDTWLDPAFAGWSLDNALARVRCPVLAIHGELDEYGSAEHPRRIAKGRGQAEILRGVGHLPYRENEARLLDLIQQFLARA